MTARHAIANDVYDMFVDLDNNVIPKGGRENTANYNSLRMVLPESTKINLHERLAELLENAIAIAQSPERSRTHMRNINSQCTEGHQQACVRL